ncbi:Tad domain-containing protein [Thalassotalea psychrophila]|uniref:Tad domain-containing protein n=1 Tax=Thalassotalea psychrophila TaxID=3065647 RepID=A0ABY9TX22_9GAMM|nr:Tad domain-containing protein [Colwelliaceae bacterium SQ149]
MKTQSMFNQQGSILVMFTIGLFSLFAMAALALDGGHLLLNKTRLQNIVDTAALNAAKDLVDGGTHNSAIIAAKAITALNLGYADYHELNSSITTMDSVIVEFSEKPEPFTAVGIGVNEDINRYVKVTISGVELNNFLAQIFSFNKEVSATALAGPSTALVDCYSDLVPMMVCSKPIDYSATPLEYPTDSFFGYNLNELTVMKIGSGEESAVGSGNFQLLNLADNHGGADIRTAMAGAGLSNGEVCLNVDEGLTTAPGNKVGPSLQGLNTRFGTSTVPGDKDGIYPPDINTCQGARLDLEDGKLVDSDNNPVFEYDDNGVPIFEYDSFGDLIFPTGVYSYNQYLDASLLSGEQCSSPNTGSTIEPGGADERRILNVVIAECDGTANGLEVPKYVGSGCFFLTQDLDNGGQQSFIIGEFTKECTAVGIPVVDSINSPGPYTIVLYHVPSSSDS